MNAKVLTICETSAILRVSRPTILALIRSGQIPAVRIGQRGQWRIDESAIVELLRGGRGEEEKATS